MIVSGTILLDLTAVPEDRRRNRAGALANAPQCASVELVVGSLLVSSEVVWVIRMYAEERRLSITVKGESFAVARWVAVLRTGELPGALL